MNILKTPMIQAIILIIQQLFFIFHAFIYDFSPVLHSNKPAFIRHSLIVLAETIRWKVSSKIVFLKLQKKLIANVYIFISIAEMSFQDEEPSGHITLHQFSLQTFMLKLKLEINLTIKKSLLQRP